MFAGEWGLSHSPQAYSDIINKEEREKMSTDFSSMTVKQLKAYAKSNNIDLGEATTKTKIVAALNNINSSITQSEEAEGVIKAPKSAAKTTKITNVITNDEGTIIVRSAENHKKPSEVKTERNKEDDKDKVALWSEGNLHWIGVGHIKKGYNIVTKEASEKWLTRKNIRLANPEEVATYYGKQ